MPASMKTAVVVMWDHAQKLRRKQLCPSLKKKKLRRNPDY